MRLRRAIPVAVIAAAATSLTAHAITTGNAEALEALTVGCALLFWLFDIAAVSFRRATRASADAYAEGWDAGYDKGYREGRQSTILRVVPIRPQIEGPTDALG